MVDTHLSSLRLVQLDQLLQTTVEQAYSQVQQLAAELPSLQDGERKRALLSHLHATRQRLQRLHILVQWCHKAPAVAECKRVLEVAAQHALAIKDTAGQLTYLKGELDYSAVPPYDVMTALHVLQTKGFDLLPSIIEDQLQIPLSRKIEERGPEEQKRAVERMNFLLLWKMRKEGLPVGLVYDSINNGRLIVRSTSGYYKATLTLVPAPGDDVTLAKYTPHEAATAGPALSDGVTTATEIKKETAPPQQEQPVEIKKEETGKKKPTIIKLKTTAAKTEPPPVAKIKVTMPKIKIRMKPKIEPQQTEAGAAPMEIDLTGNDAAAAQPKEEDTKPAVKPKEEEEEKEEPKAMDKEEDKKPQDTIVQEYERWRWRLLSYELLPGSSSIRCSSGAPLPPLLPFPAATALQTDLEARMWTAGDAAQLKRLQRPDLIILPPPPVRTSKEEAAARRGKGGADGQQQQSTSQGGGSSGLLGGGGGGGRSMSIDGGAGPSTLTPLATDEDGGNGLGKDLPEWGYKPLFMMHAMLQSVAGRAILNSIVRDEGRGLEGGMWKGSLKVLRAPEGTGIRLIYWQDMLSISPEEVEKLQPAISEAAEKALGKLPAPPSTNNIIDNSAKIKATATTTTPRPASGHALDVLIQTDGTLQFHPSPSLTNPALTTPQEILSLDLGVAELQHVAKTVKAQSVDILDHLLLTAGAYAAELHLGAIRNALLQQQLLPKGGSGSGALFCAAEIGSLIQPIVPPYLSLTDHDGEVLLYVSMDLRTGKLTFALGSVFQSQTTAAAVTALVKTDTEYSLVEGKTGPVPDDCPSRAVYTAKLVAGAVGLAARRLSTERRWQALTEEASISVGMKRITLAPLLHREINNQRRQQQSEGGGKIDVRIDPLALLCPPPTSSTTAHNNDHEKSSSSVGVLLGNVVDIASDDTESNNSGSISWYLAVCKATRSKSEGAAAPLSLQRMIHVPAEVVAAYKGDIVHGDDGQNKQQQRVKRKRDGDKPVPSAVDGQQQQEGAMIDFAGVLKWCQSQME